jgi:hypothetical protein
MVCCARAPHHQDVPLPGLHEQSRRDRFGRDSGFMGMVRRAAINNDAGKCALSSSCGVRGSSNSWTSSRPFVCATVNYSLTIAQDFLWFLYRIHAVFSVAFGNTQTVQLAAAIEEQMQVSQDQSLFPCVHSHHAIYAGKSVQKQISIGLSSRQSWWAGRT